MTLDYLNLCFCLLFLVQLQSEEGGSSASLLPTGGWSPATPQPLLTPEVGEGAYAIAGGIVSPGSSNTAEHESHQAGGVSHYHMVGMKVWTPHLASLMPAWWWYQGVLMKVQQGSLYRLSRWSLLVWVGWNHSFVGEFLVFGVERLFSKCFLSLWAALSWYLTRENRLLARADIFVCTHWCFWIGTSFSCKSEMHKTIRKPRKLTPTFFLGPKLPSWSAFFFLLLEVYHTHYIYCPELASVLKWLNMEKNTSSHKFMILSFKGNIKPPKIPFLRIWLLHFISISN